MWGRIFAGAAVALGTGFSGLSAMADPRAFIDDFKAIGPDWHVAHYDFDHPSFDTDWRRGQVSAEKGLVLTLSPQDTGRGLNRFVGASIRREEPSHYGRYEVVLQAARGAGVVTGFFTYTGPHYGTRHDEIDIEFLGRNTNQMHVAWFVDGKLSNHFIDLGFDAADRPRRYAFEWQPDRLRWFAEGRLIFEHHARDGAIPQMPGRLFANIWAADPSIANWAGLMEDPRERAALIQEMSFQSQDQLVEQDVPERQVSPEARG
jgi:beta-glucanase (GH16 family)